MTEKQTIALCESGWWRDKTPGEIVIFQLYEDRLCMDFGDFHAAVEKVLKRPVWTHEFADFESLQAEFEGDRGKPTLEEIMAPIADKAIFVELSQAGEGV